MSNIEASDHLLICFCWVLIVLWVLLLIVAVFDVDRHCAGKNQPKERRLLLEHDREGEGSVLKLI